MNTEKTDNINEKRSELKRINLAGIVVLFLIIGIFVLTAAVFVTSYDKPLFKSLKTTESDDLKKLRENEEMILNSYRVIDRDKGYFGIPVERAMELEIQDYIKSK
ncbi:hypothetical protein ACFL4T_09165 [candidate division KSB1 bacterium]